MKQRIIVLLLIGDGSKFEQVPKQIKEYGISDKVILTGSVNNVNDYLQAMDVFVFPSIYEGFGYVAIEAQASGLRVFASDAVPQSVKTTKLLEFLPLNDSIDIWVQSLSNIRNSYIRENMYEEVVLSGYNINENAINLQNYI